MSDSLFPSGPSLSPDDIERARKELAERLPELRKLPGFPKGSDEDILRMSIPPYYTACPNPFIEDWLKDSAPEDYGEEAYEDPGPYAADVSVGKSHPIYKAHSYPTKVPHEAIMRYILHYTRPGDVVLDGFCGTGMTGVAAPGCGAPEPKVTAEIEAEMGPENVRWGLRRAILQDLSPSATFIAAGLNLPINAEAFDRKSKEILDRFDEEWGWMYETTHTDGSTRKIDYTVWSEVFTCPHCGGEVIFYDAAFAESTGRVRDTFPCPNCGAGVSKKVLERRKTSVRTLAGDTIERIEFRPVKIHYRVGKTKVSKDPDEGDLEVLGRIAQLQLPAFPTEEIPLDTMYHGSRLGPKGFTHVHHLFSDRALASLSVLWDWSSSEEDPMLRTALLFWVEQAIWGLSWMNRYKVIQFGKIGGSLVNQYMTGVYYIPSLSAECSIRYNLEGSMPSRGKRASLAKMWKTQPGRSGWTTNATASSTSIAAPDASVDYVYVDPPFGANINYADLAYLLERWHRVVEDPGEEAIVDRKKERPKGVPEYQELMEACFREFHRTLRPGRWMTVEFNNSSNEIWLAIQEALSAVGFVVADTRLFDKEQKSYRQVTATNAVEQDIIISAYKPAEELEENFSIVAGSEDGAWEFVREHLRHLPITEELSGEPRVVRERMADRLYDRMVAYHVHRGHAPPLTAAQFYAGLEQRFPLRDEMYFLPEQAEAYEQRRMQAGEIRQAELFITNESSAVAWLRQRLRDNPLPFSEIQPAFFQELQAGLPEWEELPDLRELLEQNFLQDEQGRWYVPDPKDAQDLEKLRRRALLREFQTYAEGKGELKKFRSEAVKEGFREAWGRRDFGLIVKVGNRLPQDVFAEDEQILYYFDNASRLRG